MMKGFIADTVHTFPAVPELFSMEIMSDSLISLLSLILFVPNRCLGKPAIIWCIQLSTKGDENFRPGVFKEYFCWIKMNLKISFIYSVVFL